MLKMRRRNRVKIKIRRTGRVVRRINMRRSRRMYKRNLKKNGGNIPNL